jgi:hypothetical protein
MALPRGYFLPILHAHVPLVSGHGRGPHGGGRPAEVAADDGPSGAVREAGHCPVPDMAGPACAAREVRAP